MMSCATRSCSDIDPGTPDPGALLWVLFAALAAPVGDGGTVAPVSAPAMRRMTMISAQAERWPLNLICLYYSDGNQKSRAFEEALASHDQSEVVTLGLVARFWARN
jgi:hypothetical protein